MDTKKWQALAQRLERAEAEVQRASEVVDGSLESETALLQAKEEYRAAELAAVGELGARAALELVESLQGELEPKLRLAG